MSALVRIRPLRPRRASSRERQAHLDSGQSSAPRTALDEVAPFGPGAMALRGLAHQLAAHAPHDGMFPLRLPGTYAIRMSQMNTEPAYATLGPALCLIAQGA